MARNLRLRQETEDALREEALRSGRSQQEVIREALDRHLGISTQRKTHSELEALLATGTVRAPRTPYGQVAVRLRLPTRTTTADLLDRDDRV